MKRALVMLWVAMMGSAALAQAPARIPVQGVLTDAAGVPVEGATAVTFRLYDALTGGVLLFEETQTLSISRGVFSAQLGAVETLELSLVFDAPDGLFLGLQVGAGAELSPRLPLATVPFSAYAPFAGDARTLQGFGASYFSDGTDPRVDDDLSIDNGLLRAPSGGATLGLSGDVLFSREGDRVIGIENANASGRSLVIHAGGSVSSHGVGVEGGELILRAGNANVSGPADCPNQTPARNSVRIEAGINITQFLCGTVRNGDIELYAGNPSILGTEPIERMRVVGDTGNVGIGTSSPAYRLHVNGSVAGTSAYQNLSDARLKTNVARIDDWRAVLAGLRGVRFDWRRDEHPTRELDEGRQVGFLAQEVASVLPEAVSTDGEGFHSVAYASIVPVLVEAVNAQSREIETLEGALHHERARLDALEQRLAQLERGAPPATSPWLGGAALGALLLPLGWASWRRRREDA
ncbi:MAG: tail fiber domain-containing protein [Myxococcales bacterium]|nr:tail fiber domain-containing protein [Myxococcales bacterium]